MMSDEVTVVVHPAVNIVIDHEGAGWGAYVPSLPGCVAVGKSRAEVERLIEEAIGYHLDGLPDSGAQATNGTGEAETAPRP